jgi:hypothetical protein
MDLNGASPISMKSPGRWQKMGLTGRTGAFPHLFMPIKYEHRALHDGMMLPKKS